MSKHLFETYKNSAMPHGNHMFQTESDMAISTICEYLPSKYALPHWKYVLRCCAKFPHIYLPSLEPYQQCVLTCIKKLHVITCMKDTLSMKINSANCVRLPLIQ